jgi:RNA 2',3'-cyclic 3'-phosphodiesterase
MRLFTAIDLPSEIRARLTTLLDQFRPLAKLQWSKPEKLHITTTFIGEWPEARLDQLLDSLAQVNSDPIEVSVRGLRWMNRRVLCAGVEAGPGLGLLASSTGAALATIDVPRENREYHPHLTLARRKRPGPLPQLDLAIAELHSPDFGTFAATKFALFLSHGGKYTQIREFVLSK